MVKTCRRGHTRDASVKRCKACDTPQRRLWAAANREKLRTRAQAWRSANPQYHNDWMREYRKTPEGGEAHRRRENQRRLDKRYMFVRLCRSYGLEVYDFAWLLHGQGFKCAACRGALNIDRFTHIDHDHAIGKKAVRGILCHNCNLALGHMKDNIESLGGLLAYARQWWKGAECVKDSAGVLQIWEPK